MTEPALPLALDASTFFKLLQLVNLTAKPFGRLYERRHHLPLTEWRVMLTLATKPEISAVEVADALGLDKMAVSRAVRGLEARGRVARSPDPEDGRRARLALTEEGWALYRTIAPSGREREEALLSGLGPAEREVFDRLLDRLLVQARAIADG